MIYFSLERTLYAARYEHAIILLDIKRDNYLSLIEDAAVYLTYILENPFIKDENNHYSPAKLDKAYTVTELAQWIDEFKNKGFIVENEQPAPRGIQAVPLQSGGLQEYKWDTKTQWRPFSKASWLDIVRAYFKLIQVYRVMKKKKIAGLFDLLNKTKPRLCGTHPDQTAIDQLIAAVDAATILYPKKTYCLVWATTFTLMALKKGWPCQLAVGIQTNPFYAHAWAEIQGKVIGDDPQVAEVLAIICKQPEG